MSEGSELERRFRKMFARKSVAIAHLQLQIHPFDKALSEALLARGIDPPSWLSHPQLDPPIANLNGSYNGGGLEKPSIAELSFSKASDTCGDQTDEPNELLHIGDKNARQICWNGIPNTTTKYKEDQKIEWHGTPFEVRVEKALSDEKLRPKESTTNIS